MSWLAERKNKSGKTVTWLYRWKDNFGKEHQRSTEQKDKKAALRIKKHWDACLELNGCLPDGNTDNIRSEEELEIQNQIQRFLEHKSSELKPSTILRYKNHFNALLSFLNKKKAFYFEQLTTSLMLDYKFERLKEGISYKTVFEDLSVIRSLIRGLVEEEILEHDPVKKWQKYQRKFQNTLKH